MTAAVVAAFLLRSLPRSTVPGGETALKTWSGGERNSCMVAIDGLKLQPVAGTDNVVMLCGVGRDDADRLTDHAVTVSRAFAVEAAEFEIEEALSGPMRVLLTERAPAPPPGQSQLPPPHEESLWYEVALLPKDVDAFDVRTLADVERLGGRRLLAEPRWTVIAMRP